MLSAARTIHWFLAVDADLATMHLHTIPLVDSLNHSSHSFICTCVSDPVIELKGGRDRCDGQLLISGVYNNYTQVIMCDREPTPEMAEVICRQLKCGPPENIKPFSHVVK